MSALRDRFIVRIAIGYAIFAGLWILVADPLLALLSNPHPAWWLVSVKDLAFALATGLAFVLALRGVPAPDSRLSRAQPDLPAHRWVRPEGPRWLAYLLALFLSGAVLSAQSLIGSHDDDLVILAFVLPPCLSALLGGLGPGLLATAVTVLGAKQLMLPGSWGLDSASSENLFELSFLAGVGVIISLMSEALHRARRDSETHRHLLEKIISGTTDAVFIKDRQGRYSLCNEATARAIGLPADRIIGATDADIFPPHTVDTINRADRSIVEGGDSPSYEQHLSMPDGREMTVLVSKGPLRDSSGKITGIFGIARDITERKRIEQSLHLKSSALEAVANAIVITDPNGVIEWVNPAFTRLTGYMPEESIGKDVGRLVRSGVQARDVYQDLWKTILAGHVWTGEIVNRRKDGVLYDELQTITPVTDEFNHILHFVAVKQDITERKRADRLRREQATILEMIAHNVPIEQTLDALIHSIESQDADLRCSVLLFDEVEQCLRHGAAPSLPDAVHQLMDGIEPEMAAGSFGAAALRRETVIVEDLALDRLSADFAELATVHELRACWSSPVLDSAGTLLGVFAVFRREPGRPSDEQLRLIGVATHTASICIGSARALAERQESEQRFARIFDTSPMGISLSRLEDYRFVDANDAWLRLMGYHRTDVIGRTGDELDLWLHPDHRRDRFAKLRVGGQIRGVEETFRRKSGEVFEALYSASVVQIGGQSYVLATFADITLQKRAQRTLEGERQLLEDQVAVRTFELRQHVSYLRTLLDNIPYKVWLKDLNGRFLEVNRTHAAANGLPVEAIIGKTDFDFWPRERAEQHRADDAEVIAAGSTRRIERAFPGPNGTTWVETFKSPIIDADGKVLGTVGFARDISDQKALEAARENARQAALKLVKTKSAFLANMSHEIRTPLNGVLGLARIGFQEYRGHPSQLTFGRILDSGRLLLSVVDDILDFSKIEAGKLSIESISVDPAALVEEAIDLLREQASAKGLSLSIENSAHLPANCLGDPVRIKQVLMNLASNAVKFTRHGSVTVSAASDASTLVFRVADTGIGISAEQLKGLFKPFEQADSSTTRNFGGTGLGLAITKRLVEMMDGRIEVRSQVGVGSTFEVRLPFKTVPASANLRRSQAPSRPAAGKRFAGLRILAAEDGEINRVVLETMLRMEGADAVMVTTGREAVDRVERDGADAFDIVLMDIQMPEMDGYEATERILQSAPALPIVGQTAHALAEDRERCLAVGMVDYIAKPLEPEKLARIVLQHTGRSPRQETPDAA